MAKKFQINNINDVNKQIIEILFKGLTHENTNEEEFFILTSPDGTKWRIKVDNSGNLYTEKV